MPTQLTVDQATNPFAAQSYTGYGGLGLPPWLYGQVGGGAGYPVLPGPESWGTTHPYSGDWSQLAQTPGTYQYKWPQIQPQYGGGDYYDLAQQIHGKFAEIPTGHTDKQYRKVRSWADFYRTGALTSMGMMPGVEGAVDPLAQLQSALMAQYDPTVAQNLGQNVSFSDTLRQQQRGMTAQLQQQAAAMGTPGLYEGLLGQQARAREALASKAQAAYDPMRWQMQQQVQQQEQQLLSAINQADLEARRIGLTSGRST